MASLPVVFAAAQTGANRVRPLATVIFHVVDEGGRTTPFRVDSFTEHGRALELSSHFADLRATDIPFGTYDYRLGGATPATMNESIPGRVEVRWPENLVVVKEDPSYIPGPAAIDTTNAPAGFVMQGRIDHIPPADSSSEPVWIRLNPVYKSYGSFDVPVDPTGEFRIYRPLAGRYMLTVMRGEEILGVQQVLFEDAWRHEPLIISLPDAPLSVLTVHKRQ